MLTGVSKKLGNEIEGGIGISFARCEQGGAKWKMKGEERRMGSGGEGLGSWEEEQRGRDCNTVKIVCATYERSQRRKLKSKYRH